MEENDIYLEMLKKQYCDANGLKKFNDISKESLNGFIKERQNLGEQYTKFLKYMEIDITSSDIVEVNKGQYDTIIRNYNTLAITPYPMNIEKERLYNYQFISTEKGPQMVLNLNNEQINVIANMPVKIYMTQNPYDKKDIKGFEYLYNTDKYDILVGMYGKVYDEDKLKKLKLLQKLAEKIKDYNYKTWMLKDNSNYYFVLYTNKFEKEERFKRMEKILK